MHKGLGPQERFTAPQSTWLIHGSSYCHSYYPRAAACGPAHPVQARIAHLTMMSLGKKKQEARQIGGLNRQTSTAGKPPVLAQSIQCAALKCCLRSSPSHRCDSPRFKATVWQMLGRCGGYPARLITACILLSSTWMVSADANDDSTSPVVSFTAIALKETVQMSPLVWPAEQTTPGC
jgi:hypothetical protein